MITQLSELLNSFQLKILLSAVSDGNVNVVIEPKPLKNGQDVPFLQPLCLTGTPVELESELPVLLTSYTKRVSSLFEQYETQMADMEQAAKEKASAKSVRKSASVSPPSSTNAASTVVAEKRQSMIDLATEKKNASNQEALQLF